MTYEERQMYVSIIKKLYGNTISVSDDQISSEVAEIVDNILVSIRTCTENLGIFTSIVQGVADGLQSVAEFVTFNLIHDILTGKVGQQNFVSTLKENFGTAFVISFVTTWTDILLNNKQSTICVNTAKLNWKSALAIVLLGI
ncbi:hypothetical protein [Acinetobacter bereziniae]|uniref:hypothetical protein n=1 Tax=Acinetobacter bereziniae TaxID=106648 RepID=UPI00124DD3C8|nr:hypothetical protein [Acinetobacter bereziniae]